MNDFIEGFKSVFNEVRGLGEINFVVGLFAGAIVVLLSAICVLTTIVLFVNFLFSYLG